MAPDMTAPFPVRTRHLNSRSRRGARTVLLGCPVFGDWRISSE